MELLITGIIAFILGFAVAKFVVKGAVISPQAYDKLSRENAGLLAQVESLEDTRAEYRKQIEQMHAELRQLSEQLAATNAEKRALAEKHADLQSMQDQLKLQFENLANKIFETNSAKFNEQSSRQLGEILNPMRERLGEFKKHVEESFSKQRDEQISLKANIENIVNMSSKLSSQTENLTKALKGDVKAQGNWGEVILERILEDANLRKGVDYIVQGEGLGMKRSDDGSVQKPDITIHLPESKHLIIDSKVSLTHYERFCAANDDEPAVKDALLKQFLGSIRSHVKGLSEKKYHLNEKMDTPEFVLMFLPLEGAYSLAIQKDPDLHSYAWNARVAIVCPTTLFVSMQTVASLWKAEKQNRNVEEIARRGGELHDKFVGFVESMQSIGKQLDGAKNAYDKAFGQLAEGRGNLVRQVEMLEKLGARASKSMPKEVLDRSEPEAVVLSLVASE